MPWSRDKSLARINDFKSSAPEVTVESFVEQYLPRVRKIRDSIHASDSRPSPPLFSLSNREAVVVDGVHVYANLLDFNDLLLEQERETEASHVRALQFLHYHYNACDRAVEDAGAQRVDFHGARLHAAIVEPAGPENERERVLRAMGLAERIRGLAAEAVAEFGGGLASRYRIGIDSGPCIAINSGRGTEPEPLFLGDAANQAAKAAEGDTEGVFVSEHVANLLRAEFKAPRTLSESVSRRGMRVFDASGYSAEIGRQSFVDSRSQILERWRLDVANNRSSKSDTVSFQFHYHSPPLSSISYDDLSPSNTIRMPVATVFGDIDGYTKYIQGTLTDPRRAAEAVRNLHIIRGEMAAVVRDDFEGRKVRFIGDCIHAVVADGNDRQVNESATVTRAIHLAGGLRSSFDLTKQLLPGIGQLGLAIGIELGQSPISRIGVRGTRSVRVSTGKGTAASEDRQAVSSGSQTAIGERAFAAGNAAVRNYFRTRTVENMTYALALANAPAVSVPQVLTGNAPRAHATR